MAHFHKPLTCSFIPVGYNETEKSPYEGGGVNVMGANMKWALILGALAVFIAIFFLTQGSTNGAELFRNQGCIGCHSFKGKGGQTCPDLTGVTARRSDHWIRVQIKDPGRHNPKTRMPAFGHLSYMEISSIIRYLKS